MRETPGFKLVNWKKDPQWAGYYAVIHREEKTEVETDPKQHSKTEKFKLQYKLFKQVTH